MYVYIVDTAMSYLYDAHVCCVSYHRDMHIVCDCGWANITLMCTCMYIPRELMAGGDEALADADVRG